MENLFNIALKSSNAWNPGFQYTKLAHAFCDGFKVNLGEVPANLVNFTSTQLINFIHSRVPELIISKLIFRPQARSQFIWVTPKSAAVSVDGELIMRIAQVL
jgi:hypothetical protein